MQEIITEFIRPQGDYSKAFKHPRSHYAEDANNDALHLTQAQERPQADDSIQLFIFHLFFIFATLPFSIFSVNDLLAIFCVQVFIPLINGSEKLNIDAL